MSATGRRFAWEYWPGCCSPQGYWPGCYSPQDSLGLLAWMLRVPGWPGVLAWLLQASGWPQHSLRVLACLLQPGCYGMGILVWLLQVPGLPGGTGLAAAAHSVTGLTSLIIARGYWPGCYCTQHSLRVLALLLQHSA